ncbi:MAG: L,D-transpeptidase family protein [Clostridiales bacterium]|nr:L,D-transpeptidase family protein [Clostridiales bacterium]
MSAAIKKISASILTALLLTSFFSFNVSASSDGTVSSDTAASESLIVLDDETPETPENPQNTESPTQPVPFKAPAGATLTYRTRARYRKWEKKYKKQANLSGSVGKKRTLEALQIKLKSSTSGKIQYRTHAYKKGWGAFKTNGKTSGKKGYKLDMIQIRLTGALAEKYDIYYRVHVRTSNGWLDWAKNGEIAGVMHYARFIEAIQIVLTEKGAGKPGAVAGVKSQRSTAVMNADHIKKAMTEKAQGISSKTKWLILCDTSKFFAGVFKGSKGNWKLVRFIYVGVGKAATPTKKGKHPIKGKKKKFFAGAVRCKYCTRYYKNYYFHSVPYYWNGKKVYSPTLGKRISHGCIRMATDDAKYIYKNVPKKSMAYVY